MPVLSSEDVLKKIAHIEDPAFGRPLLELGLVTDVNVSDAGVSMKVRLSAPSDAAKAAVEKNMTDALASAGVINITWDLQIPMRELTSEDPIPGVRNVILVMSGKGGVGKSTCAANLALALKRAGARVGVLDADIYGPSVPIMFGVDGGASSSDGVHIEPLERFGIKLMSVGFLIDPKQAVIWRGPMLNTALKQFLKDVNWGQLDYLVIDLPPGTGDVAMSVTAACKVTGAVVVTTPQDVALQDVYRSVSMCEKIPGGLPILGVIENMSYFVDSVGVKHELFGSGGGEKIAEFAKAPLLGKIPLEPAIREWGDKGTPIVQSAPESETAKAFAKIADEISMRIAVDAFKRAGSKKAPATEGPTRLKIVR